MAIQLRSIVTQLDANSSKFLRGMQEASNAVTRFENKVTRQLKNVAKAFTSLNTLIGGALAAGIIAMVSRFTDAADALLKFSIRIGSTVEDLSRLGFVAERSGVSVETLNSSLQRQTNRVGLAIEGNTRYIQVLSDLGIQISEIENLSPDETFLRIVQAMEGLESQTKRVTAAQALWGREGTALLQIVDAGTQGIEEMMMRADELGLTLTTQAAQGSAKFNDALTDLTSSLRGLANTVLPLLLPPLTALVDFATAAVQSLKRIADNIAEPFRRAARFMRELGILPAARAAADGIDKLTRSQVDYTRSAEDMVEAATKANQVYADNNKEIKPLIIGIESGSRSVQRFIESLEAQRREFQNTQEKIEALVAWFDRLDPAEQVQNWEFLNSKLKEFGATVEDDVTRPVQEFADEVEDSLIDVDDAFAQTFDDMLNRSQSVFESMKEIAIRVLRDIIQAYATEKIVGPIVDIITSAGRGGTRPSGPSGGGAGEETGGTIATGILSAIGGIFGGIAGAAIGAAAGSILSNLIGSDQRIKETQLLIANLNRELTGPLTANIPSPFGPSISFGFNRVGGQGQLSNPRARQILDALEEAGELLTAIDQILADTLSQTQISNIGNILADLPSGSRNFFPENIDDFIRERFGAIFSAIDESLGQVFSEFAEEYESDDLIRYAEEIARIHALFEDGRNIFTDVGTAAETVNVLLSEFARNGEALSDVLARINSANGILGALGLDTDTAAGSRFNLSILEALGGNAGRLQELVGGFLDSFFSEIENLERAQQRLGGIVPELLTRLDTSRETFATDFMSRLMEGLLSPEDVVAFLEAGEALTSLIDLEERLTNLRREEAQSAVRAQIDALMASSQAIDEQIQAQRRLRSEIESIAVAISSSFGDTVEQIRFSLLNQPNQVRFLELTIEQLTDSLANIADPQALQETLDEINRKSLQLFNLLDPVEQGRRGEDIIRGLSDALVAGQERLTELSDEAFSREQELIEEQNRIQDQIADRQAEAAQRQSQAAATFIAAVGDFEDAIAQPINIQVTVATENDLVGA